MPPLNKRKLYPALTQKERAALRDWIDGGAVWPQSIKLERRRAHK